MPVTEKSAPRSNPLWNPALSVPAPWTEVVREKLTSAAFGRARTSVSQVSKAVTTLEAPLPWMMSPTRSPVIGLSGGGGFSVGKSGDTSAGTAAVTGAPSPPGANPRFSLTAARAGSSMPSGGVFCGSRAGAGVVT